MQQAPITNDEMQPTGVSPEENHLSQPAQTVRPMPNNMSTKNARVVALSIFVVIAGLFSGFGLYKLTERNKPVAMPTTTAIGGEVEIVEGQTYGANDSDIFSDDVEGVLVKGGMEGEGSHHLIREGGPSRNVYLTSSILDLSKFENYKVKIWGETFSAQKAGWLMDVGKIQVIQKDAEKPFEE
jgi:hypothetical protein